MLVAIVFAEGIRPLVDDLHRRRVPTPVGILIVYIAVLAFIAIMVLLLVQPIVSEASSLATNFPTYQKDFLNWFTGVEQQFHFNVDVAKQVSTVIDATRNILLAIGGTIFSIIVDFVLVLVVGFLWLVSSDRLKAFTVDLFPEAHHELIVDIFREMGFRMGGFLRAVAINSLASGSWSGSCAGCCASRPGHPRHLRRPHGCDSDGGRDHRRRSRRCCSASRSAPNIRSSCSPCCW